MSNPFTYVKHPSTVEEAQGNINYWTFEGMLSTEEIEDMGHIPASFRTYIKSMLTEERRIKSKLEGNTK